MQRYFVDKINNEFILTQEQIHQIINVMRNKIHEHLVFINNSYAYEVEIISLNPFKVKELNKLFLDTELSKDITLLYCLAKKDKIDFAVQKATELGVKKIVLVNSSRTILKIKKDEEEKKLLRLNKIAIEASEQCGRVLVPKVEKVIDYKDIKDFLSDINLIAYENERSLTIDKELLENKQSITILIGAEGGFSKEEVKYANELGYLSICLGKRILRSETAVCYALSLLSHYVEK